MKLSLGYQVLIAVVLGILVGLFFGPLTTALKPIGDAYTMLLEMAVIPYICLSLIHGLGSLSPDLGKKLLRAGWPFLLFVWVMIFAIVFLLSALIPDPKAPLIYATGIQSFETTFTKNFLSYLIPQNPFYDIANNMAPAVAIFGVIGGIALMHVAKKEPLIGALERINVTIEKVLNWLGILSPLAAFVYMSIAFGTIHIEDFLKIQVYVYAFIITSLFVAIVVLPNLIAALTPMSYKEALAALRYVCLLPFLTGLSLTSLPFLNIYLRRLSHKHETHKRFRETSQTVLPIAYSFGNIGNAMTLFFMIFLAYYYRHPFTGSEKTLLSVLTVPLSIGASATTINSILFLIQQLNFPRGAADFFLETKPITYNFQIMMSAACVLTLIILVLYSYYGILKVKWKQLAARLGISFGCFAVLVLAVKSAAHLSDNYQDLFLKLKMAEVIRNPVKVEVLSSDEGLAGQNATDPLKSIVETRTLKVGFNSDSIPYCYYNNDKELVGYDIAYAYQLAYDLDCKLVLVPFSFDRLASDLNSGIFDIGMSSLIMSEERLLQMNFTHPYAECDNVLVVPLSKKREYLNLDAVAKTKGLKIGAGGTQFFMAQRHFPEAQIINVETMDLFEKGELDAVFWSSTSAFVWCLSRPKYVSVDYGELLGKTFFGYPIPLAALDFQFFMNNWLSLKEQSGFKQEMTTYWIDGITPKKQHPRWSILRNVLHLNVK